MSIVTSIILTMSSCESGFYDEAGSNENRSKLDEFFDLRGYARLNFITDIMVTGKHPQSYTFAGGFNLFPLSEFIDFLCSFKWEMPENVVLVAQPEEGETIIWRPLSDF